MSTISDESVIVTIITNNGIYPGDPQMWSVWSYDEQGGERLYKLIYQNGALEEFLSSPYVSNPRLLWDRKNKLTEAGIALVNANV